MQGQSDYTPIKQFDLEAVLVMLCNIHKKSGRFFLVDLHAGEGMNMDAAIEGSPIVMLHSVGKVGGKAEIHVVEINKKRADALRRRLRFRQPLFYEKVKANVHVWHGDNRDITPSIIRAIDADARPSPEWARGIVYADPNGIKDLSVEALERFALKFPRMDILVNIAATTIKRARGYRPDLYASMDDVFKPIRDHRKRLFIREPVGAFQWTMLLFTNWADCPTLEQRGFWDVDSPDGKRLWDYLATVTGEGVVKSPRPPSIRTTRVMQRVLQFDFSVEELDVSNLSGV